MREELVTTIVAQRHHTAIAPEHKVGENPLEAYCCLAYHVHNLLYENKSAVSDLNVLQIACFNGEWWQNTKTWAENGIIATH